MGHISGGIRFLIAGVVAILAMAGFSSAAVAATSAPGVTFPVSYLTHPAGTVPGSNSGLMGPGYTRAPMSNNGRFILFSSMSDNLVTDADLDNINVFRKDTQTGDVVMVNRLNGPNGASAPGYIYNFDISGNGNLVAMVASESLDPADADDKADVYLRNIASGTTTLITPATPEDVFQASISANGAYVTVNTSSQLVPGDLNMETDIYRIRLSDNSVELVSRIPAAVTAGNARSGGGSISADGRWVAFNSEATNLIAGFTDNNGVFDDDVFVRDMTGGTTYLVSSRFDSSIQGGNQSSEEPVIAGGPVALGEVKVAFDSYASNLADNGITDPGSTASVYLKSMPAQASTLISRATGPAGASADSRAHTPSINGDGSIISFSSDAGNLGAGLDYYGTYVRDLGDSTTRLVSFMNDYAIQGTVSADGSTVAWLEGGGGTPDSDQDLFGVFKRNLDTNAASFVSRPKGTARVVAPGFNNYSAGDSHRSLSTDGRYMVFSTYSSHLVYSPDMREQVFRRDLLTGKIQLVSRATGAEGAIAEQAGNPTVSANGQIISFQAHGQLDPADTNDKADIYVRNMLNDTTVLASRADGAAGAVSDEGGTDPTISANGNRVAFTSEASNMGAPGTLEVIYLRDIGANQTKILSRANGEAGALANQHSSDPVLNSDGSRAIFFSAATNLSPDDASSSRSVYLRDLNSNTVELLSRAPGLAGASLPNFIYSATISPDGSKVAFVTTDVAAVPASAPWPVGESQVVLRNLADGANVLVSSTPGGVGGDASSDEPSLSNDGSVVAFESNASNIRPDFDSADMTNVFVKSIADGVVTGPPVFGRADSFSGDSRYPSISPNGNCLMFGARGHNSITGPLGDLESTYIFVRSGSCQNPKLAVPRLTKVTLKPAKFRVSPKPTAVTSAKKKKARRGTKIGFNLNITATVVMTIQRKTVGRKVKGKCIKQNRKNRKRKACTKFITKGKLTRKNLPVGRTVVPFSGRVGKKALKPGKYRVILVAARAEGKSARVFRSFRIVKR